MSFDDKRVIKRASGHAKSNPDRSFLDAVAAASAAVVSHEALVIGLMMLTAPSCSEEEARAAYDSVCVEWGGVTKDSYHHIRNQIAAVFLDRVTKLRERAAHERRLADQERELNALLAARRSKLRVLVGGRAYEPTHAYEPEPIHETQG